MELKPQHPIREFRFKLTFRYDNGLEEEVILTADQEATMEGLLKQMAQFLHPAHPVSHIFVDVGDKKDIWVEPGQEPPDFRASQINKASDVI